ncbi:MAG: hypothetical protein PHI90_00590 [Clostridia bacterium]|nr:hypothetical protein [Clostridia bacterium]
MEASLDTNVIIHLYKAGFQDILFCRFEKLKVYKFIREHEMKNHASPKIIEMFDKDVKDGKIELITDEYLKKIDVYNIFNYHVKDIRMLFDGGGLGEVYAIAMAETLGCVSLVTDDIKQYGPHYTLMRIIDSDVMPFAFYELLFLDYLEGRITEEVLIDEFNLICEESNLKMDLFSKLKGFIRRFWREPFNETDEGWMKNFCINNSINAKSRLNKLNQYIKNNR